MKIKIIDLLNKIANSEEMPKKILLNGIVFEYQGDDYLYKDEDKKEHWLFSASYTDKYTWLENFLKAEVEIIEEPKKIEYPILHKTAPSETTGDQMPNWRNLIDCNFEYLNKTICQLIDEINNLKEND